VARGRGGDDLDQLHLGDDRSAEGRPVHVPRHLPPGARERDLAASRPGVDVSLVVADVPLQRLVQPVVGDCRRRSSRDDSSSRSGADVGDDRRRACHPLRRRADRPALARQPPGGPPGRARAHGHDGWRAALTDARLSADRAERRDRPHLRAHRDLRAADGDRDPGALELAPGGGPGATSRTSGAIARRGRSRAGRRRGGERRAARRSDDGRGRDARQHRHVGLLRRRGGDRERVQGRLVSLRGRRGLARRRDDRDPRPLEGHHHLGRREHLDDRGRADPGRAPRGSRGSRGGRPTRPLGRAAEGVRHAQGHGDGDRVGADRLLPWPDRAPQMPGRVEFGPLPKTSTGKVQKYVLREKEWQGRASRVN